ncbi:hypothetical protein T492DRAFT_364857 [Pavlovales sp. CCMP2436]|nr:hypothetical protein T492DRAFT_364857 [Pavlovales sp. CCMP2436]
MGTWTHWAGSTRAAARGTRAPAGRLRVEGTSRCCGTRTSTAARGTTRPASLLFWEGTSRCCGTRASTTARGARSATGLLRVGTSRCCGTRMSTAARGTASPAGVLPREGTSRCCGTRTSTAARGTCKAALMWLCRKDMPRWRSTCTLHNRPCELRPSRLRSSRNAAHRPSTRCARSLASLGHVLPLHNCNPPVSQPPRPQRARSEFRVGPRLQPGRVNGVTRPVSVWRRDGPTGGSRWPRVGTPVDVAGTHVQHVHRVHRGVPENWQLARQVVRGSSGGS